ncbi:MAG: N-acetylneuraminate synthase family protein [Candidatus Omnitrophota bacterium]
MKIKDYIIDVNSECFVIAEIGHNHQGSVDVAKSLMKEAAACGVNAVKLQKRDVKNLYIKSMYAKPYDNENSFGSTYGEHREFLEFGLDEYIELKKYAEALGLIFFATAFDFQSLDFLERLGVPLHKIASADIRTIPLIEEIAKTKKPVIFSTGSSTLDDVRRAYETIRKHNDQVCVMQCTTAYPAEYDELDLNVVATYKKEFPEAIIGYSGHDTGILAPIIAYLLGARIIEKHFTLNRTMKGTDHKFSLEPAGMRKVIRDLRRVNASLGSPVKRIFDTEKDPMMKMAKSIVTRRSLGRNSVIKADDILFKSPGGGIPPFKAGEIIGRKTIKDLPEDYVLSLEDLE